MMWYTFRHPGGGFHPAATWILAALLAVLAAYTWLIPATNDETASLRYPAESAARLAERHLNFYSGIEQAPAWERQFFEILFGTPEEVRQEAAHVYQDVLSYFAEHPDKATPWGRLNIRARLVILWAETEPWPVVEERLDLLGDSPDEAVIAEAVRFAYGPDGSSRADHIPPPVVSGLRFLPIGWSHDRIRVQTAQKIGQGDRAAELRRRLDRQGRELRGRALAFAGAVGGVILTGALVLMWWWRRGMPRPLAESSALDQPWRLRDGFGVFVRAGLLGMAVFIALGLFSNSLFDPSLLPLWSSLFASLPMIWLMRRHLLRPRGLSFTQAFGFRLSRQQWRRLAPITLGVLAVELTGSLLITWGVAQLGYQPHWSEGLSERWIWGPWDKTLLSAVNLVVWAPIFEEIGFRGLVYTSLRSRWTPLPAALASAVLFSSLHLYSLLGFLVVLWSGLVWALSFERFRSLIPGMVGHAVANVSAISTVLLFYR